MRNRNLSFIAGLAFLVLSPAAALASPNIASMSANTPMPLVALAVLFGVALLATLSHPVPSVTPNEAVERLKSGNERFMKGESVSPRSDLAHIGKLAEEGQNPFVAVLACADSRVPVENIFDMGFGDIFTIRVAGNVIGPDQLGSMEYAVDHLGVPLVLILGHTNCGAINGAIAVSKAAEDNEKANVSTLLQKMIPMVEELKENNPHLSEEDLQHRCVNKNIWNNIKDMLLESAHLREMVAEGRLAIQGAVYNIFDGKVHMLGAHREQGSILEKCGHLGAHEGPHHEVTHT